MGITNIIFLRLGSPIMLSLLHSSEICLFIYSFSMHSWQGCESWYNWTIFGTICLACLFGTISVKVEQILIKISNNYSIGVLKKPFTMLQGGPYFIFLTILQKKNRQVLCKVRLKKKLTNIWARSVEIWRPERRFKFLRTKLGQYWMTP